MGVIPFGERKWSSSDILKRVDQVAFRPGWTAPPLVA